MAAADTATVLAISAARGGFCPMTTVQQSTTFQRPIKDADVLITARVTKLGRSMAFADITMTAAVGGGARGVGGGGDGGGAAGDAEAETETNVTEAPPAPVVAHATTVYALLA